ncbi:AgrD family cyclic lactone autoinducer peptide [Clostridium sp. ZS2-4]|nr:cyclic lactone autoinducer peptide [Clostridium sp. ZS2-4]MCY6354794.1 cyclic lactone autoinducer peptide [Clostridium sp. ZS2-4]
MKKIVSLLAAFFTFFAFSISASACAWSAYQPEEPNCLREQ